MLRGYRKTARTQVRAVYFCSGACWGTGNGLNLIPGFTTIRAMKSTLLLAGLGFASVVLAADPVMDHAGWRDLNKNGRQDVYENSTRPIEQRVADLLAQMTLEEKLGQLQQLHREADAVEKFGAQLKRGEISSFLDGSELIETPTQRNQLQRLAVEQSRLGIPLIFGHDSIHGFRTIFPIPLALASAWEPDLFERTQTISARETAAVGIDWTFAPMVDLARDPRWGRIAEGFGEDPWLGARYAAACVRGFQGTNPAAADRVVACMKHYVGYGATEGGRDYNTTEISDFTLRNFYLPQFKAGLDAGAWTFMSAFNCLNGIPASGNRHTLTEILRDDWKFSGYVVSDWESVGELIKHGIAANTNEAARLGLTSGVDMEMVSTTYRDSVKQQVEQGTIAPAVVEEAARRILRVKFAKGLFDRPYVDETLYPTAFLKPDALVLAREAAAKACVLLKNENAALPVSKEATQIVLIGPFAEDGGSLLGCWSARGRAEDCVSLAKGLRAKISVDTALTVLRGCDAYDGTNLFQAEIQEAARIAGAADTVILALGEPANWSGESQSRVELGLPGRQMELFEAVAATGKPVIVVLINGRPLALPRLQEKAAAIIEAWNPGVQGGHGVADVLFGTTDPAGRLTASFPRSVGQVPTYYNRLNTGRPGLGAFTGQYVDSVKDPLYPFGFGLTYTTFAYGKVELSASSARSGEAFTARTTVKNTGPRAGNEVVQLYVRDVAASAGARPVRELKGFEKVRLNAGEARVMEFKLSEKELGYYDAQGKWLVEPGRFQIWIAPDSAAGEPADFELVK